jgi:DNA-binding XRE family transcriptional regulator
LIILTLYVNIIFVHNSVQYLQVQMGQVGTYMHRLGFVLREKGMSPRELAVITEISDSTIYGIVNETSPYKTHIDVAELIAAALHVHIRDIFFMEELSHLGRPPKTGKKLAIQPAVGRHEAHCDACHLVGPKAKFCTECGAPLSEDSAQAQQ